MYSGKLKYCRQVKKMQFHRILLLLLVGYPPNALLIKEKGGKDYRKLSGAVQYCIHAI